MKEFSIFMFVPSPTNGHISQTPLSPQPLPMLMPQQQSFLVNLMANLLRHWPLRPMVVKQLPRRASKEMKMFIFQ
jgi:hypothetical protein